MSFTSNYTFLRRNGLSVTYEWMAKKPINRQRRKTAPYRRSIVVFGAAGMAVVGLVVLAILEGPWIYGSIALKLQRFCEAHFSRKISSLMRLQEVSWEELGTSNLSYRAPSTLLWDVSGLRIGQEILAIDLKELEKKLLAVPWLESVHIQKMLPATLRVRYVIYQARALAVRKGRLWLISASGKWIAPVDAGVGEVLLDLPVLSNEDTIQRELAWLDALEREAPANVAAIHEINLLTAASKMTAVVELKYGSRARKVNVIALDKPQPEGLTHLKRVMEYVVKNGIEVSAIDIRPGTRVIVNVRQ